LILYLLSYLAVDKSSGYYFHLSKSKYKMHYGALYQLVLRLFIFRFGEHFFVLKKALC